MCWRTGCRCCTCTFVLSQWGFYAQVRNRKCPFHRLVEPVKPRGWMFSPKPTD